ncbi:MAG TPA: sensor histidine kinase [Pyrinomonadaceae bacterium]|nr:sensor histidine kinase [Pyrinomonadaceae bacterium]
MENPFDSLIKLDAEQRTEILLLIVQCLNIIAAAFGALMMFSMRTETSRVRLRPETSREIPWTKCLGAALLVFALQYLAYVTGVRGLTEPWLRHSNLQVWAEFFALPINFFLMAAAGVLLNRRPRLPVWFYALVGFDLLVVVAGAFAGLKADDSPAPLPTLLRLQGNLITAISLLSLGYAAYFNTRLDKANSAMWGVYVIGFVYGGIHIIAALAPNIAYLVSPARQGVVAESINVGLVFIAALSKLGLVYFALQIVSLEQQAFIGLREKLRESVYDRHVFFSRDILLWGILDAFKACAVKLYVRVPPVKGAGGDRLVHVYSNPGDTDEPYEVKPESGTLIPSLLEELGRGKGGSARQEEPKPGGLWRWLLAVARREQPAVHKVIEPIRYHGALIGCLEIEKMGEFTYSATTLSRILSEDISIILQFYRVQESLRILAEDFHKTHDATPKHADLPFSVGLRTRLKEVIQEALSPVRTRFQIDAGFAAAGPPEGGDPGEPAVDPTKIMTLPYVCVTDRAMGNLTVARLHLDYQEKCDPLATPSLGSFDAYRKAVGSILTMSLLSCFERRFNLIIRNLSLELTKSLDFAKLLKIIQTGVEEAELDGVVIYHPAVRDLSEFVRPGDAPGSVAVGRALAAAFPDPKEVMGLLRESPAEVVKTPDRLVVGMKLSFAARLLSPDYAAIFVGVRRTAFAEELQYNTPWRDFLEDLANVAGNAFEHIVQAKKIQRDQIKQTEDHMVLSTAEEVGLITHELLSSIENLVNNSALLKLDLPESLDEAARGPIERRLSDMRKEFEALRSLTGLIRLRARVQEQSGPSNLQEVLASLRKLYESKTNVKIELLGVKDRAAGPGSAALKDVQVTLARDIVELTFGNLIRNSIAAIKRQSNGGENGKDGDLCRGLIKIWAEVDAREKLVDCYINDNGSGVPPSLRDRLFEIDASSTPGQGGWGLFYVKRRLVRNGGSINLEHSEPGNTTFRLRLPVSQ